MGAKGILPHFIEVFNTYIWIYHYLARITVTKVEKRKLSTKKIYLIRHGETDYNLKGIVQGSGVDASLNDTGRKQAELFFQKYKAIPFKKIYTSALRRTVETVQQFLDLGIPWEKHTGLNEISWGDRDGKIVNGQDSEYYQMVVDEWKRGNSHLKIAGGESPAEVEARILKVMDVIVSRPEEDVILVCMHGRAMRILLASLLHQDLKCMDDFQHHNVCLYVLNYGPEGFKLDKYNDTEHLK